MIFNIQKCSIHDGQGLRTIVFLKGCPLRCHWCANPESQSYEKEIMEFSRKCIGCGECKQICPQSAIEETEEGFRIDREKCIRCFQCTDICYAGAKEVVGRKIDIEEAFQEINKDRRFYQQSGGGVTFSGGEPLTQPELLAKLAEKCRKNRIHTTIESCGYGNYEEFKKALSFLDYMFIDMKHMDPEVHRQLTGVSNEIILDNIRKISAQGIPITIRTPVVPGCNDSKENIEAIATFISKLDNVREYELLLYHDLGSSKYRSLGRPYLLEGVKPPTEDEIRELVSCANTILEPCGKSCFYTMKNQKRR